MSLKAYKVTPGTANTDTDLIPTLSGVTVIILSLEITAPTAADVMIKRNDGTNDYQSQVLKLTADDTAVLDHKIVVPAGHSFVVQSNQTDTEFCANVNEA